ncbi:phage tail length tape measure family protein [Vreelandella venusta]|uniref:phage tail length tape measure family protein n=1 Tax=Vreelandella venusta TaxID=44935 RepID=UPI004043F29D
MSESRLSIVIDSRSAEQKAQDVRRALQALEDAGVRVTVATAGVSDAMAGQAQHSQRLVGSLNNARGSMERMQQAQAAIKSGQKGLFEPVQAQRYSESAERAAKATDDVAKSYGRAGMSAAQLRQAQQQLPFQFTDIWVSVAAGQNPLMVLIQQGTQIRDSFGGTVPALQNMAKYIGGLVNPATLAAGTLAGVAAAFFAGDAEARRFQKSLVLTGNTAGVTSDELSMLANRMDDMAQVTQRRAASALNEVAASGKFASDQFMLVASSAIRMQEAAGVAISETIDEFSSLAEDPVNAIRELNEQYNFLTDEVNRNISALYDSGRETEAVRLAMETYADTVRERSAEIQDDLNDVLSVWQAIKNVAAEAIDGLAGAGRQLDHFDRVEEQVQNIATISQGIGLFGYSEEDLRNARLELGIMEGTYVTGQAIAKVEAQRREEERRAIAEQNERREQALKIQAEYRSEQQKIADVDEKIAVIRERMADAGADRGNLEQTLVALESERQRIIESTDAYRAQQRAQREAEQAAERAAREAERRANSLENSYLQQADSLERQIALYGDTSNAARARYDVELGALKDVSDEQKARLILQAEEVDRLEAQAKAQKEYEERTKSLTSTYDRNYQKAQQLKEALLDISQRWREDPENAAQYRRMIEGVREEMRELALEADPVAKELARLWEEAGERIDETFADAFTGAFDSFDSFADQLLDGFKRLLGELAYQATLKPIVVGFTQDMQGLLGIGSGSSSSSFGGIGSLISGGKSLLGLGSTAAPSLAMQGGLSSAALASASQVAGGAAYGGWAGSAASGAALGNSAGLASSIASGISTAMPWIAGGLAIDSLLGGGITKAISGLFGSKSRGPSFDLMTTSQDPRTIFEDVQHGVSATGAFGNVGFHGGNTNRLEETFGSFDNATQFLETIAATDDMIAALAPDDVEHMTYAIQQMRLKSSDAAGIADQLGNRTKAAFGAMSGDFGAFARTLSGSTEEIIQQAQTTQQAHALLTSASERLGLQFNIAGGYAYEAAQDVAQLAGGVENLAALQQSYYQNFFTEAERAAHLTADLTSALGSMGLQLPETREGFRQLVEAQDLSTESGRQAYAQLLQLSASFSELTPAVEAAGDAASGTADALREREQLERQLLTLQGNTAELRRRDLDALDSSNRGLQQRIWALEDEQEAQREAEKAQAERIRAIEQEANAWQRAQQQLASFGVSIDNWIDNLRGTDAGLGTPGDQLAAASAAFDEQYAKALSGDQAALGSITQYADRFIEAQKGWSASGEQTVSTIDRVTGMLEKLPEQITPEQFIVDGFRDVVTNELADEIERAILDSKYTISTLIDFATNTDQLPADLRAILGEQSHRLDSTLNYLVGENQLTSDLERLAIDSTNNLVATVEYITFSQLEEDDKRLALSSSNTMTAVVDYAVRSDLDNASRRLALESSNVYGVMIEYAIERDISKDDRTLALDSINRYTAVVEYVTRSELTAGNRHLALGSLNEYDAIIDYATRNDIAGADRTLAVEKGNWYLANVDYIVGKTLTAENRRLALQSNHNYISVIDQVLGMQLRGDDRRLALQSGNTYETIVDAVLADGISPDVRKFALSKSNSLLATVDGILESNLPDDVRTLALEDSNHFVTTLEAALADGKLSRDERALLDAQSDTIFKRLETGGLKLTDDEWAVINAASGTRRLDLLADVAFNATDLDKLGDIEKNTGAAIDPNTEGMKISIGRHHNPSGLIDMAYNWGTKWADMGAPAFSGSGGGGLDYSPSNGGSSSGSSGSGSNSSTEQLSLNERARLYYQRYPDLQRYYQSNADSFHKKYGGSTYIDFAKWHWLDGPGQTDAIDRYFAKGGVFTNSIVDSPTPFNMGLMGEAGPEAIVPLHMGADGLGIKNYSAPPLPQFPLLNTQDVTQVMRDMQRTIEQKNEQIVELLKEVRGNTGQTRDAVMGTGKDAHQQREQQNRKLDRLNRNTKERVRTP